VQHAVLPTRLPLERFYREIVETQNVLARKHLGFRAVWDIFGIITRLLAHGQTNFVRMLWKFGSVYNVERLLGDHALPLRYEMTLPPPRMPESERPSPAALYVHQPASKGEASGATTG
jgi:hypothetical protein